MLKLIDTVVSSHPCCGVGSWETSGVTHGFLGNTLDIKGTDSIQLLNRPVFVLEQVHGTEIVELTGERAEEKLDQFRENGTSVTGIQADAWVVDTRLAKDVFFGIKTADCVPVLISAPGSPYVAAVHCGWKGSIRGLLWKVLQRMVDQQVERKQIEIALGPAALSCCYEVSHQLGTAFFDSCCELDPTMAPKVVRLDNNGCSFCDLHLFLRTQALFFGIPEENISLCERCTICNIEYFSYRRQKELAGRQLSFIGTLSKSLFE